MIRFVRVSTGPTEPEGVPLQGPWRQRLIPYLPWFAVAALLFACLSALAALHGRFGYDVYVIDMPVPALVALLVGAGLVFLILPRLLRSAECDDRINPVYLLTWIVLAGMAMRVVFLDTQPILEDDYNRYLLDGAVSANGISPYRFSPEAIFDGATGNPTLDRLATDAGDVLERINYPGLTTVYPPVAQAAFAVAHWLAPWSLDAWRIVLLACDLVICGLIVWLLITIGRPTAWVALYWWNPVVIKEFHNSAHMDLLVMLPVVAAALLAVRSRPFSSAAALAVGIGAKLWPALLFPTLLRPWLTAPRIVLAAAAVTGLLAAALLAPVLLAGLDQTSGFVAYGSRWQANDALFRAIEWVVLEVTGLLGAAPSSREAHRPCHRRGGALCVCPLHQPDGNTFTAGNLLSRLSDHRRAPAREPDPVPVVLRLAGDPPAPVPSARLSHPGGHPAPLLCLFLSGRARHD